MEVAIDHRFFNLNQQRPGVFLIVLNGPSQVEKQLMDMMLKTRPYLVLADGGAKRYKAYAASIKDNPPQIPDCIIGDMDSIDAETLAYFKSQSDDIKIVNLEKDQDSTDLEKAIRFIVTNFEEVTDKQIVALPAFGGRIDHTLSAMHVLCKMQRELMEKGDQIVLMDNFSKMICLVPGVNYSIQLSHEVDSCKGVGLVPVPFGEGT